MAKDTKIIHKTATGKVFNMDQLREKNELTTASGNIPVNARGDVLGPGGKIVKNRSEVLDAYYKSQTLEEEALLKEDDLVDEVPEKQYNKTKQNATPTKAKAAQNTPKKETASKSATPNTSTTNNTSVKDKPLETKPSVSSTNEASKYGTQRS